MSITVFLSQKLEKKKVSTITLHITHGFTIFTVVVKKKKPERVFGLQVRCAMKGIRYFQNLKKFWELFGIFWEFFRRIFGRNFLGEFFWRIFLGGFFWEKFFGGFFWEDFFERIFLGGFFWKEFFVYIWIVCQDFGFC